MTNQTAEATPGEIAEKAQAAAQMLESAVFNDCFLSMNRQIIDQILATPAEASAERERLYSLFKSGQMFVQQFAGLVNNHELATQEEDV